MTAAGFQYESMLAALGHVGPAASAPCSLCSHVFLSDSVSVHVCVCRLESAGRHALRDAP